MRLDEVSMAKAIKMESIVVGVEKKCKSNKFQVTNVFRVAKLQANMFLVRKVMSNK